MTRDRIRPLPTRAIVMRAIVLAALLAIAACGPTPPCTHGHYIACGYDLATFSDICIEGTN